MRFTTIICLAVLFALAGSGEHWACVCECRAWTFESAIDDADVILVATVVGKRDWQGDPDPDTGLISISSCGSQWVDVTVIEVLKGNVPNQVSFARTAIGTGCDTAFEVRKGRSYLFFGFWDNDRKTWHLSGCSPSRPMEKADETIANIQAYLALAS